MENQQTTASDAILSFGQIYAMNAQEENLISGVNFLIYVISNSTISALDYLHCSR